MNDLGFLMRLLDEVGNMYTVDLGPRARRGAKTRPEKLNQPFTRWSVRKLGQYLADNETRVTKIGRERLRQLMVANDITFQRAKTWKESNLSAHKGKAIRRWPSATRSNCASARPTAPGRTRSKRTSGRCESC